MTGQKSGLTLKGKALFVQNEVKFDIILYIMSLNTKNWEETMAKVGLLAGVGKLPVEFYEQRNRKAMK